MTDIRETSVHVDAHLYDEPITARTEDAYQIIDFGDSTHITVFFRNIGQVRQLIEAARVLEAFYEGRET